MVFPRQMQERVETSDVGQVWLADPDARSWERARCWHCRLQRSERRGSQASARRGALVNEGRDRTQPVAMNGKAKQAFGAEEVKVLADRGYHIGDEVLACEGTGILPVMPRAATPG